MKYATWILNFSNPDYGTGPEDEINSQGGNAEGAYSDGDVTKGAKILGYFTGQLSNLDAWSFAEITQQEALSFVSALDDTAFITEGGRIGVVIEGIA